MDDLALEIGRIVIGGAILSGIIWVCVHIPIVGWLLKLFLLALWGLATAGATIFVIAVMDLPRHEYGSALLTLLVGGFLSSFWFAFGLPELIRSVKDARSNLKLWEQ
jgi:hypothetical protein